MFGGEELIKDSLEYVVFERHLSDEYGAWRIHGKIVPAWQPSTPVVSRTFRRPHVKPEDYELKEAAEASRQTMIDWVEALSPERYREPTPEMFKPFAPDLISVPITMAIHESFHAGQVSAVRAAAGLARLF